MRRSSCYSEGACMAGDTTRTIPMYYGVDVGGTSTRIGLFQTLDAPRFTLITRFLTRTDYDEQMRRIIAAIQDSGGMRCAGIFTSIRFTLSLLERAPLADN